MSQLDEALTELRRDMNDTKSQSVYYDLFLNSTFFVPTMERELSPEQFDEAAAAGQLAPLVMESDGNDYLMLFDSRERLFAWAKDEVPFVEVPGHVLAESSPDPLHWALNVDTDYAKPFIPAEIAWLKQVVEQCAAAAEKEEKV